jgi:DNA-directed RNA polymerase specialized sigma24 family protein
VGRLEITDNYDNVDWEEVIPVLMAYAFVLIGDSNIKMSRSKEEHAYDFTMETITKYLANQEGFDPNRNPDLIRYLKYNILRQLIHNSKNSAAHSQEMYSIDESCDGETIENTIASELVLNEKLDTATIIEKIEEAIQDQEDLYEIFIGRYYHESKRAEICKDLMIPTSEYDNRIRRLRRVTKSIVTTLK